MDAPVISAVSRSSLRSSAPTYAGATATKFAGRANMEGSRLFKMGAMKSLDVAKAAYKGMMAGKTLVIPGLLNKAIAMSVRFSPRKMVTAISRSLQEKAK